MRDDFGRQGGRRSWDRGFTLIELMVVVLIIGILAAIAIPALVRQRAKGWDAAVASDLRNAAIAQDAFLTEGTDPGHYATTVAQLRSLGFRPSSDVSYQGGAFTMTVGGTVGAYCMTAQSRSGTFHAYSSVRGAFTAATAPDPNTCL